MYRLSSNCRYRAVPGVSDVGVVMNWMWECILLSESVSLLSRSSGSRVGSRIVHSMFSLCFFFFFSALRFALVLYRLSTEAEASWGEVDESSCFSWPRAAGSVRPVEGNDSACGTWLLSTVGDGLGGTLPVIVVRKSFLCLLLLLDRLGEVDRGRGIRKRGRSRGLGLRREMVILREARSRTCRIGRGCGCLYLP